MRIALNREINRDDDAVEDCLDRMATFGFVRATTTRYHEPRGQYRQTSNEVFQRDLGWMLSDDNAEVLAENEDTLWLTRMSFARNIESLCNSSRSSVTKSFPFHQALARLGRVHYGNKPHVVSDSERAVIFRRIICLAKLYRYFGWYAARHLHLPRWRLVLIHLQNVRPACVVEVV